MQFLAGKISPEVSFPIIVPGNSLISVRLTTCRAGSRSSASLVTTREALTTCCQAQWTAWEVCSYWTGVFWWKHNSDGMNKVKCSHTLFVNCSVPQFANHLNHSWNHTNLCNTDCCSLLKTSVLPITHAIFFFLINHPRAITQGSLHGCFHVFQVEAKTVGLQQLF